MSKKYVVLVSLEVQDEEGNKELIAPTEAGWVQRETDARPFWDLVVNLGRVSQKMYPKDSQ